MPKPTKRQPPPSQEQTCKTLEALAENLVKYANKRTKSRPWLRGKLTFMVDQKTRLEKIETATRLARLINDKIKKIKAIEKTAIKEEQNTTDLNNVNGVINMMIEQVKPEINNPEKIFIVPNWFIQEKTVKGASISLIDSLINDLIITLKKEVQNDKDRLNQFKFARKGEFSKLLIDAIVESRDTAYKKDNPWDKIEKKPKQKTGGQQKGSHAGGYDREYNSESSNDHHGPYFEDKYKPMALP